MKKTEEELEDELRKMKLKHQEIKKGKIRYNRGIKIAIASFTILLILLLISYISIQSKQLYISEVKKNINFKPKKKYECVEEIKLENKLAILKFSNTYEKVYITRGKSDDKLVVKGNQKVNVVLENSIYDISSYDGPITIEIPKNIKNLTIKNSLSEGIIIDNITLDMLYLNHITPDKDHSIKIANSNINKIDTNFGPGNLYIKNCEIKESIKYKSEAINKILIEKTKLSKITTECSPNTTILFKKMKIKQIRTNQDFYRYNDEGSELYINNQRPVVERNLMVI